MSGGGRAFSIKSDSATDGFAAVDALVALVVLAGALALCLQAAEVARKSASRSAEIRRAELLLRRLADGAQAEVGVRAGRSDGFDWRVEVVEQPTAVPGLRPCTRRLHLRDARSGRVYDIEVAEFCARRIPVNEQ